MVKTESICFRCHRAGDEARLYVFLPARGQDMRYYASIAETPYRIEGSTYTTGEMTAGTSLHSPITTLIRSQNHEPAHPRRILRRTKGHVVG
jgi:hypothetical protein